MSRSALTPLKTAALLLSSAVLLTAGVWVAPAQAQDAPAAPTETQCCSCTAPGDSQNTCLTFDESEIPATDCSKLPNAFGSTLKGWTCTSFLGTAGEGQCRPAPAGICAKGVIAASAAGTQTDTGSPVAGSPPVSSAPIVPTLNVAIPGLTLKPSNGNSNPLLAQYLSAVYNWLISITAIAATVMFVYGAFKYLLGSALPSISGGKQIMQEAVIGLLLVFGAHLILFTVNPDTVELKSLVVNPVATMEYKNEDVLDPNTLLQPGASASPTSYRGSFSGWADADLAASQFVQDPGGSVSQPFPVKGFWMFQGPWAKEAYGPSGTSACPGTEDRPYDQAHCCTSYAHAGCGPTSFATLLATAGVETDPEKVGAVFSALGARTCNSGTGIGGGMATRVGQATGVSVTSYGTGLGAVKQAIVALRSGQPVMFLCGGCTGKTSNGTPKSYGGHYMVLNGVDSTGRVFSVFDVGNPNPRGIVSIPQSELATKTGGFWTVKK